MRMIPKRRQTTIGTALADIAIESIPARIECTASPHIPRHVFKHGGARNRANRTSEALTLDQSLKLISSAMMAIKLGRALNRHVTVHWQRQGVADSEAARATTAFLKYLREWLGGQTAYVWVRENGKGKGSHVHILAHVPAGRRLVGAFLRRWIARVSGNPYRLGTIRTVRISGSIDPGSVLYIENLRAVLAYVLKGADPDTAAMLGIGYQAGGRIVGKRCGTSRNISSHNFCGSLSGNVLCQSA